MQSTGENSIASTTQVHYFVGWVGTESILSSLMLINYSWKLSIIKNIANVFW